MSSRAILGSGLVRALRALAAVSLLTLCFSTAASAQAVSRRYWDAAGRLISITDTGNLIEFFSSPTSEHIFSGNVQEGFTVTYRLPLDTSDRIAWSVHDDFRNINPGTVSGPASRLIANGETVTATVENVTWDGAVRIRSEFSFTGGQSRVVIVVTLINHRASGNATFRTAKRFVDVNVDRKLKNNFGIVAPFQAFAVNPANGRKFTLRMLSSPPGPADARAYHVDFVDVDFATGGTQNAEFGATTNENDALVGFIGLEPFGGDPSGITVGPGGSAAFSLEYRVTP